MYLLLLFSFSDYVQFHSALHHCQDHCLYELSGLHCNFCWRPFNASDAAPLSVKGRLSEVLHTLAGLGPFNFSGLAAGAYYCYYQDAELIFKEESCRWSLWLICDAKLGYLLYMYSIINIAAPPKHSHPDFRTTSSMGRVETLNQPRSSLCHVNRLKWISSQLIVHQIFAGRVSVSHHFRHL